MTEGSENALHRGSDRLKVSDFIELGSKHLAAVITASSHPDLTDDGRRWMSELEAVLWDKVYEGQRQ